MNDRTFSTALLLLIAATSLVAATGCKRAEPEITYRYVYEVPPAGQAAGAGAAAPAGQPMALDISGSPSKGPATARITIVESSDFQCPYCSKAMTIMDEVRREYPNDVRLVWKNNPLSFHKRAEPAAMAAMAAHYQGKFWEFHDILFTRKRFEDSDLDAIAQELGLDMAMWRQDKGSKAVLDKIMHDQESMVALGASGTPAFFVNGVYIKGAQPFPKFKAAIDAELAKADAELAKGTPLSGLHRARATANHGAGFVTAIIDGEKAPPGSARAKAAPTGTQDPPQTTPVEITVHPDDPFKGPKNAPVTVVEFSDFECPYCGKMVPTLKEIRDNYPKDVKIVFMQQPLSFHKNARGAAAASLAANEQGKFWEYHDLLFANRKALTRPDLERYAQDLGLNMKKFKAALDSGKFEEQIKRNQREASKVGATGTPTSFVNGWKVRGASPFPKFKTVIDRELAKVKGGTKGRSR